MVSRLLGSKGFQGFGFEEPRLLGIKVLRIQSRTRFSGFRLLISQGFRTLRLIRINFSGFESS
jgi:hypothetical protein